MLGSVLLFLNIGGSEMIFIFVVALFLFGGDKLPEIARGLGKGIRDFKDASEGVKREINNQINNYEEKRADEALNKAAEEAEKPKEIAVADEHAVSEHPEDNAPNPISETYGGVPNTMPFVEKHETSEHITSDQHETEATKHEETKTEPVKTTMHE
jgi:sec-independent protein translocase protein TatA